MIPTHWDKIHDRESYQVVQSHSDPTSADINTLEAPLPYRLGLLCFYTSFGLTFVNMSILDSASLYRLFIAALSAFGFLLALGARGTNQVDMKQYPLMSRALKIWFIYVGYLTVVTYMRSDQIERTFYTGTIFYFMTMSMLLVYRHIQAGYDNKYFWQCLMIMALFSTAVNFYFARFSSAKFDESEFSFIEDMRSQIISGSNMIIIAVGIIGIIKSRYIVPSYFLVFLIMFVYIVAKTRNILLGVVLLALYAVLLSNKRYSTFVHLIGVMLFSLLITYLIPLYFINFDIIDAWFGRVFTEDESISVETFFFRVGEYKAQLLSLTQDLQSGLFGFGYLRTTIWDAELWDVYFPNLDPTYYYMTRNIGMHSTWINSLFQGGFIMGTIPTITSFLIAGIGLRQILLPQEQRNQLDIYGLFGCGVVIYMLIPSTFGMMYVDRLSTVSFGAALMYALYGWDKFRNEQKHQHFQSERASTPGGYTTGPLTG